MRDFKELLGDLVKAGVHFGHQKSRWCPKMAPYIWGYKNKVHLIDVSKTAYQLEKSARFLESIAAEGKTILWIGTKKAAEKVIRDVATKVNMPHVSQRWIGGTLSNFPQVKKSLTRLLHYEDILAKAEQETYYTKKELNLFKKNVEKLDRMVGGIRNLTLPVGAIVLVDVNKEQSALKEAVTLGVPVVAVVDTNSDPTGVDIVIPGNDDSVQSISLILNYLGDAVEKGKESFKSVKVTKAEAEKEKKEVEQKVMLDEKVEKEAKIVKETKEEDAPSSDISQEV